MEKVWYSKLGFTGNPFSIKPAMLSDEVVGHHLAPILENVEKGSIQYIEAPLGSGKTTILKGIIKKFGGNKKVAYTNCIKNECIRLKQLLQGATFSGRLLGNMPNNMILLVDEAQELSLEDAGDIEHQLAQKRVKSVVFFGTDYVKENMTPYLQEQLKGNIVNLPYLTPDQAIELVRTRVGDLKLLPDYVIRDLYARSGGNPRRLLQLCEDTCRKAVDAGIEELTVKDVELFLKKKQLPKEKVGQKKEVEKKDAEVKPKKEHPKHEIITEIKDPDIGKNVELSYSGYDLENIRTYEEEFGMADPYETNQRK